MGGGVTARIGRRQLIGAIGDMQRYPSHGLSWWWARRIGLRRISLVTVPLVSGLGGFGFVSLWLWWSLLWELWGFGGLWSW